MQEPSLKFHPQSFTAAALVAIGAVSFVLCINMLFERLSCSTNCFLHQLTQELISFCQ